MAPWSKPLFFVLLLSWVLLPIGCGDITGELTSLTVSPGTVTVGVNQSYAFMASGRNSVGTYVTVVPTWSVEGGIGTITSNGLFKAAATAGAGSVVATSGSMEARATVTLTATGWLIGTIKNTNGGVEGGISVYLAQDQSLAALSDTYTGKYTISNIPAGQYSARINAGTSSQGSFPAASSEVTISEGTTVTWNPFLSVPSTVTTTTTMFQ